MKHDLGAVTTREVTVEHNGVATIGDLAVPPGATGVVLFAHGTGSGRHSPRNRMVAAHLEGLGLATLLMDLLTGEEDRRERAGARTRFDIGLLAGRLVDAVDWLCADPTTRDLPIGLFGASTGAAAALVTAAERPDQIVTVVSRGGRPDLAGAALERVLAPALFIVGTLDTTIIDLNIEARDRLDVPARLELVDGATHLFDEPGALERVAELAGEWLRHYLAIAGQPP